MGFAVALEMAIENPQRYSALIGLAPVGTRGTRVGFNEASAGTDALGNNYTNGDWVPVADEEAGIEAARFQQRSWQGAARTRETVSFVWNMLVINDTVGFDLATFTMDDPSFTQSATYHSQIRDVMNIDYMPRSLFYSHAFNISNSDITHTNNDGSQIIIPGDGRISQLPDSIPVLLVKATTDFANWQGDQVIYDNYIATSKYDFKQAGAQVTAILIDGGYGYDHGFPTVHPLETVNLVDSFLKNALTSAEVASQALDGTPVSFYPNNETEFETNTFTGF